MIKVMLVDNDSLIRHGLQMLLQGSKGIHVHAIEPFSSKSEMEMTLFRPDIAIFPVDIHETGIMSEIRRLRKMQPQVKVLILMSVYEEYFIMEGLKAGVEGFLLDEADIGKKQLLRSIKQLYDDNYVLTGKIAVFVMEQLHERFNDEKRQLKKKLLDHHIDVSWRELDILYLMMKRRKNKEMAVSLHLTEKTIRDYVSSAYKKIGKNKRQEAVAFLQEIWKENEHFPLRSNSL